MKITRNVRTASIAVLIVLAVFVVWKKSRPSTPDPKIAFGQCLTDKGAKFYGAYWCPHCTAQKKLLGKGFSKVTYIECAVPGNPQKQTEDCKNAKIEGYPTWIFADGARKSGEVTLRDLADQTGCPWNP
ncbi:hypothetical protein HY633_01710 [Candidatus Uhrbacteria bacterium]|nr:hypothetical protein [Candidatus Uhrbacteria bacterium]